MSSVHLRKQVPSAIPAPVRPWDRLILPEDFRLALIEAPAPRQHAVAVSSEHLPMQVLSAVPAPDRPWDRLILPEDLRLALIEAPAPRRVRRRITCYCGQVHDHIGMLRPCSGVATGSALTIHQFCEFH